MPAAGRPQPRKPQVKRAERAFCIVRPRGERKHYAPRRLYILPHSRACAAWTSEASPQGRGKARLCARARPQEARSAHKCGRKARFEGGSRRWKRGCKPRASATRPNRKRRYRKRGRRRALAHSSYRRAAGARRGAAVWRHGGEMPPSREGEGCRRSQGRSAPRQKSVVIHRATRRGGSYTAAASITRPAPRTLRLQPEGRGSGRPQAVRRVECDVAECPQIAANEKEYNRRPADTLQRRRAWKSIPSHN